MNRLLYKSVWVLLLSIILIFPALGNSSLFPPPQQFPNQHSPLGTNTKVADATNTNLPFVDLFRLAQPFSENIPKLSSPMVVYDDQGWPKLLNGGQAGTTFLSKIPAGALSKGEYTVRYDGVGEISYTGDAILVSRMSGKDIIRFKAGSDKVISAGLTIKDSLPDDYLRNIRILMPGGICANNATYTVKDASLCKDHPYLSFADHHRQIIFKPDYLNYLKDFKVLRFLELSGGAQQLMVDWQARPTTQQASWGGSSLVRGVPVEIMVELSNQLNINPWFNMPYAASDHYISRFAQLVKNQLKPNLKVFVEYAAEPWSNKHIDQKKRLQSLGTQQNLDTNAHIAALKYYAKRSVEAFKIWDKVLGDSSRLVRVLSAPVDNVASSQIILEHEGAAKYADALAIYPSFEISEQSLAVINSTHDVFEALASSDNPKSINNMQDRVKELAALANSKNLNLISYAGGQSIKQAILPKASRSTAYHLSAANRDARMAREFYRFLSGWKKSGGNLFVTGTEIDVLSAQPSLGIKEYINQPNSELPKYQALLAFKRGQRCWWRDC